MADRGLTKVLQTLRHVVSPPDAGRTADGQLLTRFVVGRDESAFAALVRQHGPMVYGVCRRVLGHEHDAEDAFQAAFLVLVRKAGSVVKRESVGSWLYGVAYRTALEARAVLARRRLRERPADEAPDPAVEPPEPQDWRPLLDRELNRLPEKYREAVVLCDLEGRPRKEAARRLRVAEGTLSSRLAAARRLLARRLTARGLTLSGGALATSLSANAANAAIAAPTALISSTVRAASLAAAGRLTATAGAAALSNGVIKAMWMTKLKIGAAVLALAATAGAGGIVYRGGSAPAAGAAEAAPASELETLRKENELLKVNLKVLLEKVKAQEAEIAAAKPRPAAAQFTIEGLQFKTESKPEAQLRLPGRIQLGTGTGEFVLELSGDAPEPAAEAEAAIKAIREAKDKTARERAVEALENALKRLRDAPPPKN
jgi:RNA polymerase sigma factor (sigma-70 family)